MTDALHIILEDRLAGTISRLRGGRLRFRYHDATAHCPGGWWIWSRRGRCGAGQWRWRWRGKHSRRT